MTNGQSQIWSQILDLKLESAGLNKVNIKEHTTSRLYGFRLCIIQSVPKAYQKCCVQCKMKCSHLKSTQKML